jgi:hypothetical protein
MQIGHENMQIRIIGIADRHGIVQPSHQPHLG